MERWDFMTPWCEDVEELVECNLYEARGGIWSSHVPGLHVSIPDDNPDTFLKVAETIKLLAAVAHVDYNAWRYLLATHCRVQLDHEQMTPVEFLLVFDLQEHTSTVSAFKSFCGVHQFQSPSSLYIDTLAKIAALSHNLNSGVELKVPVRMYIQPSTSGLVDNHQEIRQAEHFFKKSCESSGEIVPPGSIRCSFRLVPMVAEYNYFKFEPALVRGLGKLVTRNVWLSQFLVSMDTRRELLADARAMKKTVGHLFARLFDSAARSPELPIARSTQEIGIQRTDPLQLGNSGAFVRWEFNGDGQPVMNSRMLTFESPLAFVRTFSDDGVSNWVDAIIPGLGKCQVQRCDLVFYESSATDDSDNRLESLTIGFHEHARVTLDALYELLLAVGRTLKFLRDTSSSSSN